MSDNDAVMLGHLADLPDEAPWLLAAAAILVIVLLYLAYERGRLRGYRDGLEFEENWSRTRENFRDSAAIGRARSLTNAAGRASS